MKCHNKSFKLRLVQVIRIFMVKTMGWRQDFQLQCQRFCLLCFSSPTKVEQQWAISLSKLSEIDFRNWSFQLSALTSSLLCWENWQYFRHWGIQTQILSLQNQPRMLTTDNGDVLAQKSPLFSNHSNSFSEIFLLSSKKVAEMVKSLLIFAVGVLAISVVTSSPLNSDQHGSLVFRSKRDFKWDMFLTKSTEAPTTSTLPPKLPKNLKIGECDPKDKVGVVMRCNEFL